MPNFYGNSRQGPPPGPIPGGGMPPIGGDSSDDERKPIGVNDDYRVTTQRRYTTEGEYPNVLNMPPVPGYANQPVEVGPRYFAGDQYEPSLLSPQSIMALQRDMALTGLLTSGTEITPGFWDQNSADAYGQLLSYANRQGISAPEAMNRLKAQMQQAGQGGRFTVDEFGNIVPVETAQRPPLVIRQTDPRTLEIAFRDAAMNLLGEGLDPGEVQDMVAAYQGMEANRQRDAYNKELAGGTVLDIPSPQAWSESQIAERFPEGVEDYRALQYMTDAMTMLGSPAWGM